MRVLLAVLVLALMGACDARRPHTPAASTARPGSLAETTARLAGQWVGEDGGSTVLIAQDGTWRQARSGEPDAGRLFYWSLFPGSHPPFGAQKAFKRQSLYIELKNANEPLQPSDIFELASVTADGFTILALGGSLFSAGERQSFSRPRQEAT